LKGDGRRKEGKSKWKEKEWEREEWGGRKRRDSARYEILLPSLHTRNFCFSLMPVLTYLYFRNCAANFVEICNVYAVQLVVRMAINISNSGKLLWS